MAYSEIRDRACVQELELKLKYGQCWHNIVHDMGLQNVDVLCRLAGEISLT